MSVKKLLISLVICLAVAYAGSAVTIPSIMTWYATLHKPFFTPPNYIFGPVWTLLYLMMALALAKIWSSQKKNKQALQFFFIQLGLNFVWSLVFFGLHVPFIAFTFILLLWAAIFITAKLFLPISRAAAYLLIPYLMWVSYAAILNLAIVIMNF
ncbi:MAG TPA: TspO/MBR family protein [Candidatus Acidoferrales bacterium]|nr:TspO/MBR family protein [Candidatus Acidoferrales bacterium]